MNKRVNDLAHLSLQGDPVANGLHLTQRMAQAETDYRRGVQPAIHAADLVRAYDITSLSETPLSQAPDDGGQTGEWQDKNSIPVSPEGANELHFPHIQGKIRQYQYLRPYPCH